MLLMERKTEETFKEIEEEAAAEVVVVDQDNSEGGDKIIGEVSRTILVAAVITIFPRALMFYF